MKPTQEQIKKDAIVWIEGATHYTHETEHTWPAYYKVCGNSIEWKRADVTDSWSVWMLDLPPNAIPRPTKPAFVPEVGEWCESLGGAELFYIGKDQDERYFFSLKNGGVTSFDSLEGFRPIKSERELLIEVIVAHGNLSEGVLADGILTAGFCLKETDK